MNDCSYYDFDFFEYDLNKIQSFPDKHSRGLKKYSALLPVQLLENLSLGEGQTALTKAQNLGSHYGYKNLFVKHEEQNPTGNFKDRESLIAVTVAKERGLKEIVITSSGNAALSMAAYAKNAGILCRCFVPSSTSKEKKDLIRFFGGVLEEIDGNYEQVYRYVADHFDKAINFTSGINSERIEGNKTIAYEIWEEMGVPDVVVVPCGNGGNLAGIWRGFADLKQLGKTNSIPIMVGVQVTGAAPLKQALENQTDYCIWKNSVESVAEGILAEESYCSPKAVEALNSSKGFIVEVSDGEIITALKAVTSLESLLIEPTSAAAFAAVPKLEAHGVKKDASVVVVSTGSGMKMLEEIMHLSL